MAGKATRNKGRRGQQEFANLLRSLIRQLLRWHRERGVEWLRGYVERWPAWAGLRVDFWAQQRLGNGGEVGQWLI